MIFPVGVRVARGPTWMWGEQDGGGFGTVVAYEDDMPFKQVGSEVWQRVKWDHGGRNGYRVGLHQDIVAVHTSKTFNDFL